MAEQKSRFNYSEGAVSMESHLSRCGGRENNDEYFFLNIFSTLSLVTKESIAILWGSPWERFSTPEDLRHEVLGTFFLWGYPYFFYFRSSFSLLFMSFVTNLVCTPDLTFWCSSTLYCVSILGCIEISSTKEIRPFPFNLSSGRFSGQYPKAATSFAKIL